MREDVYAALAIKRCILTCGKCQAFPFDTLIYSIDIDIDFVQIASREY